MRLLTQDIIICNELKYMIEHTQIEEGDKLPGERELAAMLDVQRATVRKGLKLLVLEGWIYLKKRSGYYVAPKRITKDVHRLASTTQTVKAMGKEIKLRVIKIEKKEVGKDLSAKMRLSIGTNIFYIVRLREVEKENVSVELSYIPVELAPTLTEKTFDEKSLFEILENDFLIDLDHSKQMITVEKADAELAHYLGVAKGTDLVKQEGLVCNRLDEPVEYSISYMKMNRFEYANIKEED